MSSPIDNRVRLRLAGQEVLVAESYRVQVGIFTVPSAFELSVGHPDVVAKLFDRYPPSTPFELSIGNTIQFRGNLDAYDAATGPGGGSVVLRGRDHMAYVVDAYIDAERSWTNTTYAGLVTDILGRVVPSGPPLLLSSNAANRSAVVGRPQPDRVDQNVSLTYARAHGIDPKVIGSPTQQKTLQAKVGQRWYDGFLKPELDRAGLFLWATALDTKTYVLSAPNPDQAPAYKITRQRGAPRNAVNVLSARHGHDTVHRYSEYTVYARGGGRKAGITKVKHTLPDEEMKDLSFHRPWLHRDSKASTPAQCEAIARRKRADDCRRAWRLSYTVKGHVTQSLAGGLAVWSPDTIALVEDDEFDLHGPFYVESVEHSSNPQTTTTLTLLRPQDLVFGAIGEAA